MNEEDVDFNLLDDEDDDILLCADDPASAVTAEIDEKHEEMPVDLEGIDFDEEMEDEGEANISIGLDTITTVATTTAKSVSSGFDVATGKLWIYPTNYPIRDYQYNIVQQALYKNTLVVLPTGLGKTFIAAVAMYNLYRWFPQGKIVFMAPTKPLVAQQIMACYNIMGIPKGDTVEMTGNMPPAIRQKAWRQKRVVFLTPQVMTNDLSRGSCTAESIKCLVIDEAHKALGNHAYCQVVRELVKFNREFRVLALSATPGSDLKAVQQVMNNLLISHIELRTEDSIDIRPYTHERKVEKIVVPLGEELSGIRLQYIQIMTCVTQRLSRNRVLYNREATRLSKFLILKARDEFRQNPPQNMQQIQFGNIEADFALAISLYHGFELLQLHGLRSLYNFLTGIITGDKGYGRTRSELLRNADFNDIMEKLRLKFSGSGFPGASTSGDQNIVVGHPKMQRLEEIVVEHFASFQKRGQETRVMIFSQYRDSVQEISAILNQHQPLVKVMPFIGQSSAGKATKGYTQKEQLKVMQQFRDGGYNTLVSTCVGEEGLDIGDVDLIVCFDAHKSPIRLVQRMGRTGRKRQGRIVMLVTQGKEEQIYNQSLHSKKSIHKAILNGARSLHFYPSNPRLVPISISPQCHKMYITVNTQKKENKKISAPKTQNTAGNKNRKISDAFVRQAKQATKDGHLTELEYEEIKQEFSEVSALAKHLPARKLLMLNSQAKKSEEKSNASVINLSEWMPWQNRLHKTHIIGHSTRTIRFVKDTEFIELQQCLPAEEDNYGFEMGKFFNQSSILHEREIEGQEGQSSIVSFLTPNQKKTHENQEKRDTGLNENSNKRSGHENRRTFSDTGRKDAEEATTHSNSIVVNSESSLDEFPDEPKEAVTNAKHSSPFTEFTASNINSDNIHFRAKTVHKSRTGFSKSRKKAQNQKGLATSKKLKKKIQSKKPKKSPIQTLQEVDSEGSTKLKKKKSKRSSILQLLESNNLIVPYTKDSADFENAEGGDVIDAEAESEKQLTKEKTEKDGSDMTFQKNHDNECDAFKNVNDLQDVSYDCNAFLCKTFDDKNSSRNTEHFSKVARDGHVINMPMVPAAPPISEVKCLFQNLISGSEFANIDLEELVKEWPKLESEASEDFATRSQEFVVSRNMQTATDRSSENFHNFSCETELLTKHYIGASTLDSGKKISKASLNSCKNGVCNAKKKDLLQNDYDKLKRDHKSLEMENKDLVHDPSILEEIDIDVPKSPFFKRKSASALSQLRKSSNLKESEHATQKETLAVTSDNLCINNDIEKDSRKKMKVLHSQTVKGMSDPHVFADSQNLTNMSDFFASSSNDLEDEVERLVHSKTTDLSFNMSGIKQSPSSTVRQSKISTSLLSFTQALDYIHISSSEDSLNDIDISSPAKLCVNALPANHDGKRKTASRPNVENPTSSKSALKASGQRISKEGVRKGLNLYNLEEDSIHDNKDCVSLETGLYDQSFRSEIAITNKPLDIELCSGYQASSPPAKRQESKSHSPSREYITTPQKYSDAGDELPQFDLGFDFDDDIIPPTPEKNLSQPSLCSVKCEASSRIFSHISDIAFSQNTKDRILSDPASRIFDADAAVTETGIPGLKPTSQVDTAVCADNQNLDLLEDIVEVNDFNLVLTSDESEGEEENTLKDTECKQNLQFPKQVANVKSNEWEQNTENTQPPLGLSGSLMEISFTKPSMFNRSTEDKQFISETLPKADIVYNENKRYSLGTLKAQSSVTTNNSHGINDLPSQTDINKFNKTRVLSPSKQGNLPFSRYNSDSFKSSSQKFNFDLLNENPIKQLQSVRGKSRTSKLKLESRKSQFTEVDQNDERSCLSYAFRTDEPKEMNKPWQLSKCGSKFVNNSGKVDASSENTVDQLSKPAFDNGVNVLSDFPLDDEEMFALCKEIEKNDNMKVSTPIKSNVFVSHDRNSEIVAADSCFRESPSSFFSAHGNVGRVDNVIDPHREKKNSLPSAYHNESNKLKASTPVEANVWLSKNTRCKQNDMEDLTPIKKVGRRNGDAHEDDSDESFIIRRKRKVSLTSDVSSENEAGMQMKKSRLKTRKQGDIIYQHSDSSSHGENSKSTSVIKEHLSVLGDVADDMGDFEDSHSFRMPQKQILKEKYNGPKRLKKGTGFIEQEAEVSGEEASSDEQEGMDDYYEQSFIDNNTEMSQTQATDMRAVYLRSVKSPPLGGVANRFRLQYKSRHANDLDIYSQALPEDQGMSDYEEDSFCVGSDEADISYVEDETQLEVQTKKKAKSKTKASDKTLGKKRRIRMMSNSSSDEEENRIQLTQEFTRASLKDAKRAFFSSSEDEKDRVEIKDTASKQKNAKKTIIMGSSDEWNHLSAESKSDHTVTALEVLHNSKQSEDKWTKIKTNATGNVANDKNHPESFAESGNFDLLEDDDFLMDFDPPYTETENIEHEGKNIVEPPPLAPERKTLSLKNSCENSDKCNSKPSSLSFSCNLISKKQSDNNYGPSEKSNSSEDICSGNSVNGVVCTSLCRTSMASCDSVTQSSSSQAVFAESTDDYRGKAFKPVAMMTREERLRKQKEKQERFRQKLQLVEQAKAFSSIADKSVVKTSSPEKDAQPDYLGNKTNFSVSDVKSLFQGKVVDANTTHKTSPSFTKITQTSPCTSKEHLQILVDSKEISGAQDIISALRIKYNIKVTARQLPHCDYILSNHLAADRMQWSAFSNSTNRNKLSSRLREMQGLYDRCVLIVEANKLKGGQEKNKKPVHHTKYLDTSLSYLVQTRVKMYFTDCVEETADLLSELCHVEGRKGRSLSVPASLTTKKEEMFNFMLSIPKVTVPQALNITHRFRNIAELVTSPAPIVQERGCMSAEAAQSIHRFLRYQFDLQMTPISKR